MVNETSKICDREIKRLNKNVRIIINKNNLTDNDFADLNRCYNDLDYYNYHKNYKAFQRMITEELDNE